MRVVLATFALSFGGADAILVQSDARVKPMVWLPAPNGRVAASVDWLGYPIYSRLNQISQTARFDLSFAPQFPEHFSSCRQIQL